MTAETLKPCAHCGSTLVAECSETDDEVGATWHFVRCTECCAHSGYYQSRQEAVEAWNRRAPDPLVVELVEALKGIISDYNEDGDGYKLSCSIAAAKVILEKVKQ